MLARAKGKPARRGLVAFGAAASLFAIGCRSADVLYPSSGDAGVAGASGAPERGLVLRYPFEEGEGTTTRESTADRPISELVNGAAWTDAVAPALRSASRHALVLTGDQFLRTARDLREQVSGSCSVSVWLSTTDVGSKIDPEASPGLLSSPEQHVAYWGVLDDAGRIGVVYGGSGAYSSVAVNDGAWHHVALTYDWGSGELKAYVDGVVAPPAQAGSRTDKWSVRELLRGTGGRTFRGSFDELRLYDRTLAATEIDALSRGQNADGTPIAP